MLRLSLLLFLGKVGKVVFFVERDSLLFLCFFKSSWINIDIMTFLFFCMKYRVFFANLLNQFKGFNFFLVLLLFSSSLPIFLFSYLPIFQGGGFMYLLFFIYGRHLRMGDMKKNGGILGGLYWLIFYQSMIKII